MDGIVMSKKEMRIYRHAMNVIEGRLSIVEFSTIINKSYRQAQRIIKKIKDKSVLGAIHGNTGKIPINKTCAQLMKETINLLETYYSDFNLVHFTETIKEKEGIEIGYSSLYRVARKKQLIKQQKRRSSKCHKSRARLPCEGMLIQFDGSEHKWFGNMVCDLIAGIDDATGEIVSAEFFIGETSLHSMKVIQNIIEDYGVPEAFYMDEASIFGKRERDWNSQIARAFETLGINLILASSPQAKGRVERLFRTLQDRLIAELNFVQITNILDANRYLKDTFIPAFNKQFSHAPRDTKSCFSKQSVSNLDIILCRKEQRKITAGNTFSYKGLKYILKENRDYRFRTLNINTHQDYSISYDIMGKKISVEKFKETEDNGRMSA